jgi:hypothetical protein
LVAVGVAGGEVGVALWVAVGMAGGGVDVASSVAVAMTGGGVGVASVSVGVGVGDIGRSVGVTSSGRRQAESNASSSKLHRITLALITGLLIVDGVILH